MEKQGSKLHGELNAAVKTGTVAQVRQVLQEFKRHGIPVSRVSSDWDDSNVYKSALERGGVAIVGELIDACGGIDCFKCGNEPPLYWVTCYGNEELFDFLLSRGANVNQKGNFEVTALHRAAEKNLAWVKKLVDAGADIYAESDNRTPYDVAIDEKKTGIGQYLLKLYHDRVLASQMGPLVIHYLLQGVAKMKHYKYRHISAMRSQIRIRIGTLSVHRMNILLDKFLSRQPDALQTRNEHGELPIHRAFRLHFEDSMIRLLFERVPGYIDERDCSNNMPIHIACEQDYPWPTIRDLVKRSPTSLYAEDSLGKLPIHIACGNYLDIETFRQLIDYHDGHRALRVPDRNGDLPIHCFCQKHKDTEILRYLVDRDPATLQEENNDGELPLHCACRARLPLEGVQVLLEQCLESVQSQDDSGNLPIHLASRYINAPLDVVKLLLEHHQASLFVVNRKGDLPLHCACRIDEESPVRQEDDSIVFDEGDADHNEHHKDEHQYSEGYAEELRQKEEEEEAKQQRERIQAQFEKVRFLVERGGSDALLVENSTEGALPLHLFCALGPPLDLVKLMVQSAPESVSARTQDGSIPLEVACQASSLDVIYFLLRAYPDAASSLHSGVHGVDPAVPVPVRGKRKRKRPCYYNA